MRRDRTALVNVPEGGPLPKGNFTSFSLSDRQIEVLAILTQADIVLQADGGGRVSPADKEEFYRVQHGLVEMFSAAAQWIVRDRPRPTGGDRNGQDGKNS